MSGPEQARLLFQARYLQIDPDGSAEILLSGGVDSATVLFAALSLGFKPRCHTFFLADYVSKDLLVARSIAKLFHVELNEIPIPVDLSTFERDVRHIIREMIDWRYHDDVRATLVQTMHPFLYVLPEVHSGNLIMGSFGDHLSASARRASEACHDRFARFQTEIFRAPNRHNGDNTMEYERYCAQFNVRLHHFYLDRPIYEWASAIPLSRYNSPRQKGPVVDAFGDYWRRGKWYRRNGPYQIVSRIRELHDKILKTEWNNRGYTKPIGCYRAIANYYGIEFGELAQTVFSSSRQCVAAEVPGVEIKA